MKTMLLPVAMAAFALAGSQATAETLSAAAQATKEQLAAHLGVNPDDFTLLELTQLNCRMEAAHDDAERQRLLQGIAGYGKVQEPASEASKEQLAESLGVSADDYELSELVFLKAMVEDDSCTVANPQNWAKADERLTFETAAAKQQLAALLGVKATEYTLAELVKMRFDAE